jgi:SAM-dependent methyltransferase
MKEYFEGIKLYGNDFSFNEIKKWYDEEAEGYADLGSNDKKSYSYGYHMMNQIHGFNKLKKINFENVLGFGSAWGYEFEPIVNRINELTIVEPSDNLVNNSIGDLIPKYVKPDISGCLMFEDNIFDLITCFGTLHHIPNVSFVLSELIRVLKPNGYLLIREPIISMGDWRNPRKGLTKNERGIAISFFEKELGKYPIEIVSKDYCFTVTSMLQRIVGFLFKKPIYSYKIYVFFDKFISTLLKKNVKYHATKKINRISPQSIFYVIKKNSQQRL